MIFTIYLVITAVISLCLSQSVICNDASECIAQNIATSHYVYGEGYKSLYGSSTSVTTTEGTTSSYVYCFGAFACYDINFIKSSHFLNCGGTFSCANIDGDSYIKSTGDNKNVYCQGSNSCQYSNINAILNDASYVSCNGDQSCAFANIESTRVIYGDGAYSLSNAIINSKGLQTGTTMYVVLNGYYSGYKATIKCQIKHTCTISCTAPTGCYMLNLECNDNCNVIDDDNTALDLLYNSSYLTNNNEILCGNSSNIFVYDDAVMGTGDIMVNTIDEGPVCCRGADSCRDIQNITFNISSGNVICSGDASCGHYLDETNIDTNDGNLFCEGTRSCQNAIITNTKNVYCIGNEGCYYSYIIGVRNIYCGGSNGCREASISSGTNDINVYLLGYNNAGENLDIVCNTGSTCTIVCGGYQSCDSITALSCDGNCIIRCDVYTGCPVGHSASPTGTDAPTAKTMNPSVIPTSHPSIHPTITMLPTIDPTIIPTADPTYHPTSDPTVNPTNDPTSDPIINPTFYPTVNPTNHPTTDPTLDPTVTPTTDPSFDPTIDPTIGPTIDPTFYPTVNPTHEPTADPSIGPTVPTTATVDSTTDPTASPTTAPISLADALDHEMSTIQNKSYTNDIYMYSILCGVPAIIIVLIFICKSTVLKNTLLSIDRVQYVSVVLYFVQVIDLYSDVMFCVQLYSFYEWGKYTHYDIMMNEINTFHLLFVASLVFIILPYCANLLSSARIVSKITSNDIISQYSKDWFKCNSSNYSIGVILSGGSYYTLKVINSNFLGLPQLSAGLSSKQIEAFAPHKVYCSVLLENVPQMVIQFYFVTVLELVTPIAVVSMVLSVFNILLSLLSTLIRRTSFGSQKECPFSIHLCIDTTCTNPYQNAGNIQRLSQILKSLSEESGFDFEIMSFSRIEKLCKFYGVVLYEHESVHNIKRFLNNNVKEAVITAFELDQYDSNVKCSLTFDTKQKQQTVPRTIDVEMNRLQRSTSK